MVSRSAISRAKTWARSSIDDVIELANPVLRHRMALNFTARAEGVRVDDIIDRLCEPFA